MHFLIETKCLLSSPGKIIGEQYKIKGGIAQAETIRHKRDLWTFIVRSLRIKKTFSENIINMSGPGHARGEMYTCLVYDKSMVSIPGHKTMEVVVQPLLVRTFVVRITKHEIIRMLQQSAVTGWEGVIMQGEKKGRKNSSLRNTHIVVQVRRAPTI